MPEGHLSPMQRPDSRRDAGLPLLQAAGGPASAGEGEAKGRTSGSCSSRRRASPASRSFYRRYGKWLKLAVPALIAIPALWIVFLLLTRLSIDIPKDPAFPIEVAKEKKGGRVVLLKGTVTNLGEDIPDLSLRSIGVTAEIRWNDGKVERKRVFPKSAFRGEGALFHGESGTFEFDVPPGADAVTLRAEIVNLGGGPPRSSFPCREAAAAGAKRRIARPRLATVSRRRI